MAGDQLADPDRFRQAAALWKKQIQAHPEEGESHNQSGVVAFGTSASYRAANRTTADLARVLSDQFGLPPPSDSSLRAAFDHVPSEIDRCCQEQKLAA